MNTNQNEENKPSQRGLKNRHIQLIAIAGTIGTGLFLGAGNRFTSLAHQLFLFI